MVETAQEHIDKRRESLLKGKGTTTKDKGTVVPPEQRVPYDPDNIRLKKSEFVEKQQKMKEKNAEMAAYSRKLDQEKGLKPLPTAPPKRRGRKGRK